MSCGADEFMAVFIERFHQARNLVVALVITEVERDVGKERTYANMPCFFV